MNVMIGTPMYGGMCHGRYLVSLFELSSLLFSNGHTLSLEFMYNESLIQRARNNIATRFLEEKESDVLLFIDADIHFNPQEIYDMLLLDKDIIGAVTPLKGINWQNIRLASLLDKKVNDIPHFGGYYNVNVDYSKPEIAEKIKNNEPFEVDRIGTGVMAIKKNVIEEMSKKVESYNCDIVTGNHTRKVYNFFPVEVKNNRLMSEDFSFCNIAKELGFKVHATAYPLLCHTGTNDFYGNLTYELNLINELNELQKR